MTFLAIPAFSVWTWSKQVGAVPAQPSAPSLTHRLPVEIIPTDDKPKWVLVPIDPS